MKKILITSALFIMFCLSVSTAQAYTLYSPLEGNIADRTVSGFSFGDNWTYGSCDGLVKKHVGVDVAATAGEYVYAAAAGLVKVAQLDATWGGWVTIDNSPLNLDTFSTVYWHVIPTVSVNTWVSAGDVIGYIANLGGNTHFHFGVCEAGYISNAVNAGALSQTSCGGYPAYPWYFVDPEDQTYLDNDN